MTADGDEWPVRLRGVTEALVTTLGPNDLWNVAALGIHSPDDQTDPPTARTWGRTRTWRNFRERGEGYVQFTRDPVLYVDAALGVREQEGPILDDARCWVRVRPEQHVQGTAGETQWTEWQLVALETRVVSRTVPTFNRGYAAVVEATIAASRLDVAAYDTSELWDRITYFEDVADRCGGPRVDQAFERLLEHIADN